MGFGCDSTCVVALFGERGGLGFFVGKIVLGDRELGLAGLTIRDGWSKVSGAAEECFSGVR